MTRTPTLPPTAPECIWVLCDLADPDAVRFVHDARALFQDRSDLAGFGPDHMILVLFPGGARRLPA